MRVLILTTQLPFVRGGAEIHAEGLCAALRAEGHLAEIVALPFKWYPAERIPDHMAACRLFDLEEFNGQAIDRVIGLKFPAYLVPHPNKVLWLLHQHRQAYELWEGPYQELALSPLGLHVRQLIQQADNQLLAESRVVYTNSATVSQRLRKYNGVGSTPLYHPPLGAEQFYSGPDREYLFFPSRITVLKRQSLILEALAHTRQPVRIHFAGQADSLAYGQEMVRLSRKLRLEGRVAWLGVVGEHQKRDHYAHCRGVVFPPLQEDLGYVTLEAMLAAKPVVTCSDSGGPLEFVQHEQTGLVAEPDPVALAEALDRLWAEPEQARIWGHNGRRRYDQLGISWPRVVRKLMA